MIDKEILGKYTNPIFVETRTRLGNTVQKAIELGFEQIYSVEVMPVFYEKARIRFKDQDNVIIILDDSVDALPAILSKLDNQTTFWLDAHRVGGEGTRDGAVNYPVIVELDLIKNHHIKTHTILIDDRHLFRSWKVTDQDIINKLHEINPRYMIGYEDGYVSKDIIVAVPPKGD